MFQSRWSPSYIGNRQAQSVPPAPSEAKEEMKEEVKGEVKEEMKGEERKGVEEGEKRSKGRGKKEGREKKEKKKHDEGKEAKGERKKKQKEIVEEGSVPVPEDRPIPSTEEVKKEGDDGKKGMKEKGEKRGKGTKREDGEKKERRTKDKEEGVKDRRTGDGDETRRRNKKQEQPLDDGNASQGKRETGIDQQRRYVCPTSDPSNLNFFSLPDVFLRKLMRSMELKDRRRLRLTCRAFEKLVAETHAGYFRYGSVDSYIYGKTMMKIHMNSNLEGYQRLSTANLDKMDTSKKSPPGYFRFWDRLFSGIIFDKFVVNYRYEEFTLAFLKDFTAKFKINELAVHVETVTDLERSLELMKHHQSSKYVMRLSYIPDSNTILSLPKMETLTLQPPEYPFRFQPISSDIFFKLIAKHTNLHLADILLAEDELMRAIQIIATEKGKRYVHLRASRAVVTKWMRCRGINEKSKIGQSCGEYNIVRIVTERSMTMEFRYRGSGVRFGSFVWTQDGNAQVFLTSRIGQEELDRQVVEEESDSD